MDTKILEKIGLTNREIEVYVKLLKEGESTAANLAKDSSISRTHVYESVDSLIEKGLASSIIKNFKKYYTAAAPERINNYLENKQKVIEDQKNEARDLISRLNTIQKPSEPRPKIATYEGKEGIKAIMMDTLKVPKSELLIINATKHFKEAFTFFAEHYFKDKIKRKIKSKVIFAERFEFLDPTAEKKFLPSEDISPTTTVIYQNKVAILFWLEKPMAVVIESKEAVKEYRNYFDILWKVAKK